MRDSPLSDRIAFWTAVAVFVIEAKEAELIRGEDKDGNPMAALAEITIKHRRSAMGPADPDAPPLQPAHGLSRTRSLFTAEPNVGARGVICWWTYDDASGDSWGEILAYHRAGGPHLPVRDVIGLSPASVAGVQARAWDWWESYVPGSTPEPPLLLGPKSGITIDGHHYDLQSGTAADIEAAIEAGTFSGWGTVTIPRPGPTFGFTPPTVRPPVLTLPIMPAEEAAAEALAAMPRVDSAGDPAPGGKFVATDEFLLPMDDKFDAAISAFEAKAIASGLDPADFFASMGGTVQTVAIADLRAIQEAVSVAGVAAKIDDPGGSSSALPVVLRLGDELLVFDGTHRVVALDLMGVTETEAVVIDLGAK